MQRWLVSQGVMLSVFVATTAPGVAASWLPIPADKAAHFGVSYVLTDQLLRVGLRPEQAVAVTLLVGLLKEMLDDQIDPGDLGANAAGSLTAGYMNWRISW